jgi:diguanylate cyclase (GGDEF)-like protein/PAS domain S-box-containing protein
LELAQRRITALEGELARERRQKDASEAVLRFREAVIEQAAEGVCVCHDIPEFPFVRFTVWNRRMCEITGYTMEEINRRGWYQTMYPDPQVQERARHRMDRMRTGEDLRFERWEVRCADGATRPIAISTSVLVAEDGSVHVLGLMQDLSQQEALREEAERARTDELTAVRNRRGFEEQAGLLIELARRTRQPVTLAFMDLARFKNLNDTRGHNEGDRALRAIGGELLASVRSLDVVGRVGGDEFALALPGMTARRAKDMFGPLAKRLQKMSEEAEWGIGFNIGVVTYTGVVPALLDAIEEADRVMYRAKDAGRTRVEYVEVGKSGARVA